MYWKVGEYDADSAKLSSSPSMIFNKNLCLIRNKINGFCYYFNAKECIKYINYDYRESNYVDYQKTPSTYNSASINHVPDILKVKVAKDWMGKAKDDMNNKIEEHQVTSDWTFTSPYKGSIAFYQDFLKSSDNLSGPDIDPKVCEEYEIVATDEKIPVDRLTPENPILYYQDLHFFEDELDDFGKVEERLRFRVMDDCAFGLLRCYLR